jgi:DNA-binding MarR family transcriptional regulator
VRPRDPGDGDRRRVDVDLTVAGREVLGQADAAVDQRMERILELLREIQA